MDVDSKRLISDIQSISDSIRQKHRALKRGILETESVLEKTFKPVVDPLKTLTKQLVKKVDVDESRLEDGNDDYEGTNVSHETPQKKRRASFTTPSTRNDELPRTPDFLQTYTVAETPTSAREYLTTPQGRREGEDLLNRLPMGVLAKEYIRRLITDTNRLIDYTYGPHYEGDTLMIGDSKVEFDMNDIIVNGIRYTGTQGLYELIFMKTPDVTYYRQNDLDAYKSILIATNAHRQRYQADGKVNSNKGYKYRNIISKLFGKIGGGVDVDTTWLNTNNSSIEYVHWNDPNELVDRLRLLIASERAGHTGHNNEIVSIIEELREAGIVL